MNSSDTITAIMGITRHLIESGICDDQNFPSERIAKTQKEVVYNGFNDISIALKNVEYHDIYNYLEKNRQFNFKLIDGGLIQLLYLFDNKGNIIKHNLGYFPSPNYEPFQNEPELYLDDNNYYLDMTQKSILPVPVRFDYDPNPDNVKDVEHPICHLTLGQYKNCRIPVISPLCPVNFVSFILRSFYNTAIKTVPMTTKSHTFQPTITVNERNILHLSLN